MVDNNSTDRTADVIKQWADQNRSVHYLRCSRQGSYAARNMGIAYASGNILAFTDADCAPAPGWLEAAVEELVHKGVDRLAGEIHIPGADPYSIWGLIDASFYLDQEQSAHHGWAATANLVVWRHVFERAGLFHEGLISWGDIEFGCRCTAAGITIGYSRRALVVHAPRTRPLHIARRSRRIGFGQAQIMHEGLPTYMRHLHSWRNLLPRPLSPRLCAERLGHVQLNWWQRMQLQVARYLTVETVQICTYVWGRWVLRQSRGQRIIARMSRSG